MHLCGVINSLPFHSILESWIDPHCTITTYFDCIKFGRKSLPSLLPCCWPPFLFHEHPVPCSPTYPGCTHLHTVVHVLPWTTHAVRLSFAPSVPGAFPKSWFWGFFFPLTSFAIVIYLFLLYFTPCLYFFLSFNHFMLTCLSIQLGFKSPIDFKVISFPPGLYTGWPQSR